MRLYAFSLIPGTPLTLFASGLILAGAIILLISGVHTWRLVKSLNVDFLKHYWVLLISLIGSFFIGYVISGLAILSGSVIVGTIHILFSGILFLGAIFVGLVVRVSSRTIRQFQETTYSRDFLSTVVNSINEALFIISPEGQIEQANNNLHKLIEGDNKEIDSPEGFLSDQSDPLSGAPIESILGADPIISTETLEEDIENLPFKTQETRLQSGSDGEIPVLFSAVPLRQDDKLTGVVCTARDVTERKQRQQQLKLVDRVLRHNVRNDMNVVRGRAEIMHDNASGMQAEHAEQIIDTSNKLIDTAETEQKIAKLFSDSTDPISHDAAPLLQQATKNIRAEFPNANVAVECPDGTAIRAKSQFRQAIEELLTNAIVHNPNDAPEVEITVVEDAERVQIRIADTCPRIPKMERDVLSGNKERTPLDHASGLGLWFVQFLVSRSNGSITFEQNSPSGNIVILKLPDG